MGLDSLKGMSVQPQYGFDGMSSSLYYLERFIRARKKISAH